MRSNLLRWLLLAGAVHITLTLAIFLVGHFQLLPSVFDSYGTGLSFAIDGASYRSLASQLATEWQSHGFAAWLAMKAPLHCRLYSILFASVGRMLGNNILAAEPLNLFYYLGILSCVYLLGREIVNVRAGLLAAIMVGAWPSFLLHSTQLIRDPLSILCLLALLLVLTWLLTRRLSWRAGVELGVAAAGLVTMFWVVRGNMWNVVIVAAGITLVLLSWRMMRTRSFLIGNALVIALVLIAMLLVPSRLESTSLAGVKPPRTPLTIPSAAQPAPPEGVMARAIKQIDERRGGFRSYTAQESNIDRAVRLRTLGDILRFLPRATVIGFFAPFPRMWLQSGSFGLVGRLLSGAETLAMYFLYFAAGVCVWRNRRHTEVWLLFLVAVIGMIALGLVVVNAGALYRLRYVFWIVFIIIAADSLVHFTVLRTSSTNSRMSPSVVSNDAMNRTSEVSSFHT